MLNCGAMTFSDESGPSAGICSGCDGEPLPNGNVESKRLERLSSQAQPQKMSVHHKTRVQLKSNHVARSSLAYVESTIEPRCFQI